jgi:hypothetical protein
VTVRDWIEGAGILLIILQLRGIANQLKALLTKYDYINGIRGMEWSEGVRADKPKS